MRIIVYPHDLSVGGSQINAIDLAAAVRDRGHDVIVFGARGPLVDHVRERGLEYIEAAPQQYRPAPQRIAQLRDLARRRHVDVVHGYEWPPCLDAYFGAHLIGGVGVLCTVLSMSVPPQVPQSVPLIMGTEDLARAARRAGHRDVTVLEPPIDVESDHPAVDGSWVRRSLDLLPGESVIATVSRLAIDFKLDALERAICAVGEIARSKPMRLVIVGGGEAEGHLRALAADVNAACGRRVVEFAGMQLDPRPYYAAADVVLGMGSSSLRAMAMGRATIVQGDRGFALTCEPKTVHTFLRQGFWGVGEDGPFDLLQEQIERLVQDDALRNELGRFGRRFVVERFALADAAERLENRYAWILERGAVRRPLDVVATAGRAALTELRLHDPRRERDLARAKLSRRA